MVPGEWCVWPLLLTAGRCRERVANQGRDSSRNKVWECHKLFPCGAMLRGDLTAGDGDRMPALGTHVARTSTQQLTHCAPTHYPCNREFHPWCGAHAYTLLAMRASLPAARPVAVALAVVLLAAAGRLSSGLEFEMSQQLKCIYEEINANVVVLCDWKAFHKDHPDVGEVVDLRVSPASQRRDPQPGSGLPT